MINVNMGEGVIQGTIPVVMAELCVATRALADKINEIPFEKVSEQMKETLSDALIDAIYLREEEEAER